MLALVTGGAGFLGSHLCERLLNDGMEVVCLDNMVTGASSNISQFLDHPKFTFIQHDVSKPFEFDGKIDYIFHMASPASPPKYQDIPVKTILVNCMGTYHMLNLAKSTGAKFLFSSTSEVYGDPQVHPQHEEYWGNVNPIGIRSCYDESKRVGESLVMSFYRECGLDVRIIRIFNTYGPRMSLDDGRAIPNFIKQGLNGSSLTIFGDGNQTRSFCYVDDLIDGITKAMFTDGTKAEVFNLGNPSEVTVLELAKTINDVFELDKGLEFRELPKDDPARRKPDISKAQRVLGYSPMVGLDAGLRKTVDWFKSRKDL